jgi:general stress protein 26
MGRHMRSILSPERRLTAEELAERLRGMKLLVLATVNHRGEPRVGPVDGHFYRGAFWFGSAPDSIRFRHIRKRPAVSATHLDGEAVAVTVHGEAEIVDIDDPGHEGFRDQLIETYGEDWWHDVGVSAQFARINARRMYVYFNDDAGST